MDKPTHTSKQELIDRTGELFREQKEPRFPTVREKLLSGVVKPDAQVFFSSFDHLNPAYPSRIVTGKLRADGIVSALQNEKVEGVSVMLDLISPESDRQNEGGGWSLGLGIVPDQLTRILRDRETFYAKNELIALDQETILRAFSLQIADALLPTHLTGPEQETYVSQMLCRLSTTLGIYNFAVGEALRRGLSGSEAIVELRNSVEQAIGLDTRWIQEVRQSTMLKNIADALEEMTRVGYPFWKMPGQEGTSFLRFITEKGTEGGNVIHDRASFTFFDRHKKPGRTIRESAIFDLMRKGEVIPRTNLLLFAIMSAPEIPHFGNTYALEQASVDWLNVQGDRLKIEPDFQNSIPLGHVAIGGKKSRSLLPLSMLHFPRERLREIIKQVSETGVMPDEAPFGQMNAS